MLLSVAHRNVRLFITHGGLLSMQEAINRGVPVVGIPAFGDQQLNMFWATSNGFGVLLDFKNITTESVTWALDEVLNNPRYSTSKLVQFLLTVHASQKSKIQNYRINTQIP
jgi:UDP:flavonoid glycosyltransferase YjiC (YdhE family)